jgi:hypothetical protein
MTPNLEHDIHISYQADGAGSFSYGLNQDRRTDKLAVTIKVDGLQGSKIPKYALAATTTAPSDTNGQIFTWDYANLVANRNIQLELPQRLSFTQRVAAMQDEFIILGTLAPILVTLFVITLFGLFRLSQIQLPLASYLLSGLGLVLFYPLLTFLSGLLDVFLAALIALAIISGLLFLFLALSVGWRATSWRLGWLLLIFLVIFSLGLLTPLPGLMLTVGSLLLVGTFMVLYALQPKTTPSQVQTQCLASLPTPTIQPTSPAPSPIYRTYCPQCGRGQANDYQFCPGCGYDTQTVHHCAKCHHEQVIPADRPKNEAVYCLHCGTKLT